MAESRSSSNAFSKHGLQSRTGAPKKTDPGFQHFPTQVLATATVYTVSCAVFPPARIHGNTPSLTTAWASVSRISTLSPADMLLLLWSNVSTGDSVNFPTRVTSDVASVFEFLSRKPPIDICNPDAFQLNFICSHTPTHHAQNHRSDIILIYEYTIYIYIYICARGERRRTGPYILYSYCCCYYCCDWTHLPTHILFIVISYFCLASLHGCTHHWSAGFETELVQYTHVRWQIAARTGQAASKANCIEVAPHF